MPVDAYGERAALEATARAHELVRVRAKVS